MDGVLSVDKPAGMSSFSVLRSLRGMLRQRSLGHAGTLDPQATGVLVVAAGRATKLIPYLPVEPKRYEFDVRFGMETDTLDETGEELRRCERVPSCAEVEAKLPEFTGDIQQTPPKFSAVKIDGVRAYRRARNREEFSTKPRSVHISELALVEFAADQARARLRVVCSGGTYVRSLARDLALALDSCGHAAAIRRTAVGRFTLQEATSLNETAEHIAGALQPYPEVFAGYPQVRLDETAIREVSFGRRVRLDCNGATDQPVIAFRPDGELAAVLKRHADGWLYPSRVFIVPEQVAGRQT